MSFVVFSTRGIFTIQLEAYVGIFDCESFIWKYTERQLSHIFSIA